VRMSLHTGRATVGDSGASQGTDAVVVGDPVTRAVALQERAASGAILCSETTARLVQRVVRLKAMPLVPVDGQSTPERVYKLLGQRKRRAPAISHPTRARTPLVGRAREVATLRAVWTHVTQGPGHGVGVVGEAGMGKSRLVAEFRASLRHESHTYIQGQCVPHGQTMASQPVRALLRHACGITEVDSAAAMAAKVHRRLQEVGMD